jgi:hypothetical protein
MAKRDLEHRALARLHMSAWSLGIAAWVPLALGELARALFGMAPDPAMYDLAVHVRLLFSLPVLIAAGRLLDEASSSGLSSFRKGGYIDPPRLDAIATRAASLREARWIGVALLAAALLGGQLALWEVTGVTGVFHGGARAGMWSFPRVWYALIALPLTQVVLYRWLWRWLTWVYVLVALSRSQLVLRATHPDLMAGLSPLTRPLAAASGGALAVGAVLAGAWGTQLLEQRTTLRALYPDVLGFLLVVTALALGPMLLFTRQLFAIRRRTLTQYGEFAREYTERFQAKWIGEAAPFKHALGSPDIQSLADLGNAYDVVSKTRPFAFGLRNVVTLWAFALLPMAPLLVSVVKVEHVVGRIVSIVLGGIPL